jgi:hypothetical protein
MKTRKTVKDMWDSFAESVVPAGASPQQVSDMRACFYSGALATMNICLSAADGTEDEGVETLQALTEEATAYMAEIMVDSMIAKASK